MQPNIKLSISLPLYLNQRQFPLVTDYSDTRYGVKFRNPKGPGLDCFSTSHLVCCLGQLPGSELSCEISVVVPLSLVGMLSIFGASRALFICFIYCFQFLIQYVCCYYYCCFPTFHVFLLLSLSSAFLTFFSCAAIIL